MAYTLTTDELADLRADLGIKNTQVVTISGSPTGGTFTLTYNAQTTAAIAYNATEIAVQTALQALSTIGAGGCIVTGQGGHTDAGGPYTVVFARDEGYALTATGSGLTGGTSPAVTATITPVFSDTELQRNYTRAVGDFDLAHVITLRQLWANDAKMTVYTIGVDGLNKQKVFENVEKLLEKWEKIAGAFGIQLTATSVRPRSRFTSDELDDFGVTDTDGDLDTDTDDDD